MTAWDSIVFSVRGRMRARLVFAAFGLPTTGKVTVEPRDMEGREAIVEVRPADYCDPTGDRVVRNEVPYDGYHAISAREV